MASLQDQLLKAGVVNKKKAKKIKLAKHSKSKKAPKGQAQIDENKQLAEIALAERVAKDKALNIEKKRLADNKAVQAQIIQLIKSNAIDSKQGDSAYQFTDNNVIKKIYVTETVHKQLSKGFVAIAKLADGYEVVPAKVAEKIAQRDETIIVLLNDSVESEIDADDPYADYQIPDDLMW